VTDLGSDSFDDATFFNFCQYIRNSCGIVIRENKKTHLGNRLRKRIKELQLNSFAEYWAYLTDPENRDENYHLYDAVTINETYFQRGSIHYKILTSHVLPGFYKNRRSRVSLWSCATSTGEEAWDLAMEALEFEKNNPGISIDITATDISRQALEFAQNGQYADRRIDHLTENQTGLYFIELPASSSCLPYAKKVLAVKPVLREKVAFSYHNMISDDYVDGVDVIFCRNVLIYFDPETRESVVEKLYRALHPGGYLFLGHSDALQTPALKFTPRRFPEGIVYQKP